MSSREKTKGRISFLLNHKEDVPDEFNRIAHGYDLATSLSQGYQEDLHVSAQRMHLKGDERVLDLCCGTGKSTAACLVMVPLGQVIGVDYAEEMLAVARAKFIREQQEGRVEFIQGDAMNLGFPDETFDAIFMAYGLRNMPDYEACLRRLYRILKPGGVLCLHDYFLADHWAARFFWWVLGYGIIVPLSTMLTGSSTLYRYLVKSVLRFLNPAQARFLLEKVGFIETQAFPLKSWRAPILHTVLGRKPIDASGGRPAL